MPSNWVMKTMPFRNWAACWVIACHAILRFALTVNSRPCPDRQRATELSTIIIFYIALALLLIAITATIVLLLARNYRFAAISSGASLVLVAGIFIIMNSKDYFIDTCLDRGGRYNNETGTCEFASTR